jgi:hypothetical protein
MKKTKAEIVREQMAKWASLGGKARDAKLTPTERREIARKGGLAKAAKRRASR